MSLRNVAADAKKARAALAGIDLERLKRRVKPTQDMIEQYLRFLSLRAAAEDWAAALPPQLSPPAEVDALWHAHILDTVSYQETCALLGRFVHHDPDGGDDPKARAQRRLRALKMYEETWGAAPQMWKVQDVGGRRAAPAVKEEGTSSRTPLARTAKGPAAAAAAAPPAPAPAPAAPPPADHINLKAVSQDGNEIVFRCNRTAPLSKLMSVYCQRTGLCAQAARFFFDGERLMGNETPEDLEMEEGDTILVGVAQGGC